MNLFFRNFASLATLQGANYLLPLVSVPYLVRTLGADRFGILVMGQAFAQYFVVLAEYGFNYSATRKASILRDAPADLASLFWNVSLVKASLMAFGFVLMAGIVRAVPHLRPDWPVYYVSYLMVLGNVLLPTWLFQGLERMTSIAVLSIGTRAIMLLCLFIFVKHPGDYVLAAGLQAAATPIAGIAALCVLHTTNPAAFRFRELRFRDLRATLIDGWHLFVSTAAISLYSSSATFVLGLVASPVSVTEYSIADKLVKAMLGLTQPVTQALYPRMSYMFSRDVAKALGRLKLVAVLLTLAGVASGVLLFAASDSIVVVLFGRSAEPASRLVRIMSFVPLLVIWSNLLGVQLLFSLGQQAAVSRFQIVVSVLSIVALVPMAAKYAEIGSALNYLGSEILITIGFVIIAMRVLRQMRQFDASA